MVESTGQVLSLHRSSNPHAPIDAPMWAIKALNHKSLSLIRHKLVQEEGSPFGEESSMYSDSAGSYLKEVALSALNCYAYDEDSQSTSDTAEERSYMSCPDIAACFNSAHTKKMVDYAWRTCY